jgi:hypothetical protein
VPPYFTGIVVADFSLASSTAFLRTAHDRSASAMPVQVMRLLRPHLRIGYGLFEGSLNICNMHPLLFL